MNLLKPVPAAGDPCLLFRNKFRVEFGLGERALDNDWLKIIGHNELGQFRVTANMFLGGRMEQLRIELSDYIPQVEVAVGDVFYVVTADAAEIAFVTLGHLETRRESELVLVEAKHIVHAVHSGRLIGDELGGRNRAERVTVTVGGGDS